MPESVITCIKYSRYTHSNFNVHRKLQGGFGDISINTCLGISRRYDGVKSFMGMSVAQSFMSSKVPNM